MVTVGAREESTVDQLIAHFACCPVFEDDAGLSAAAMMIVFLSTELKT